MKDRFEKFIHHEPNSGCWLWGGAVDAATGYGRFMYPDQKTGMAHRASYELYKGPIPDGMFVCHTCDVRCCVNPDHLFVGTHQDNMNDRDAKDRGYKPKGELHHQAKLTEDDIHAIRADTRTHQRIAENYGVRREAITKIKNGRRWSHV